MREIEDRVHKHIEQQFEELNFKIVEVKLKQD